MIYILRYKTPKGIILTGKFLETNKGFSPCAVDEDIILDETQNKILDKKVYFTRRQNGTRSSIFGRSNSQFSEWMRENLPSSYDGFRVADFDWILWDQYRRNLMILEEKRNNSFPSDWLIQLRNQVINPAFEEFCKKNNINFKGYNLVKFENNGPDDGKITFSGDFINDREINSDELKRLLSMK